MSNEKLVFVPRTRKEIFDSAIRVKRDMVNAGETAYTSEAPNDFGITLLSVVASTLADQEVWVDARLKQAALINASHVESVVDNSRSLGYIRSGPKSSVILCAVTASAPTFLASSSVLKKELSSGKTIYFEILSDLTFEAAGTKQVYAIQGEAQLLSVTGTGLPRQQIYFSHSKVNSGVIAISVDSVLATQVSSFQFSDSDDSHYRVEFDYYGRPIIIWGDGVYGKIPAKDSTILLSFYTSEGLLGNVPPGTLELIIPNDLISLVTNEGPTTGELVGLVTPLSTEVTIVDDGSIVGFATTGFAYIDEDLFNYDGITGVTFENVTGLTEAHSSGEIVRYTLESTLGEDAESLTDIKTNAMRANKIKTSANSTLDYAYLASKVVGVKRAYAYNLAHSMFIQVVPSYGGVPSTDLKQTVYNYIEPLSNGRHLLNILDPKYVYIDVELTITPMPGVSFEETITPLVSTIAENFLSPLTTFRDKYYTTTWGGTVRRENLTYILLYLLGGRYIAGVEVTGFKKSTAFSGNINIDLEANEISNKGEIVLISTEIEPNPGILSVSP